MDNADVVRMRQYERMFTKQQCLHLLQEIPQSYWPPRPTRQDKATLFAAIYRAYNDGAFRGENWLNLSSRMDREIGR
jgi:hypothetical protein